jgi:HAD superfamily hydrolase (TIGR01509 family)
MAAELELIIFDCDGVLVDSETITNRVFARILNQEFGLKLTLQDMYDTFMGRSSPDCQQIIKQMTGRSWLPDFEKKYRREIADELAENVTAIRGVEGLLKELQTPYCVASNGTHQKMNITLGKAGLLPYISDNKFSATDVERGKPFPDVYLYAAKSMGARNIQKCLVVEDTPVGVTGAVAAGMQVAGYSELISPERLLEAGAHFVIKNMDELTDIPGVKVT